MSTLVYHFKNIKIIPFSNGVSSYSKDVEWFLDEG